MREHCSPAVLRAVEAAAGQAFEGAAIKVAAANLLMALIEDEDGRATVLLARHGVNRDLLWEYLAGASSILDVAIDRILADAGALTREHGGEGAITSEFLLLALLRSETGLSRVLKDHGLNLPGLEREILGEKRPPLPINEPLQFDVPSEKIAAGRILDANANRAREALRLLDDYCRFVLNDALLTREAKQLRHDLAALLDRLPAGLLVAARETEQDVGTAISTSAEAARGSSADVARINLKRLQEAFRSLEEFGKLFTPDFAEGIERLRYRSYTLEKALRSGEDSQSVLAGTRLCVLLTGSQCAASLDWTIAEAAAGGATMFQLREKNLNDRELLERARNVRKWTRLAGALFIVNDRPDIARLADADGVHLGQEDLPVQEARKIIGPDALIGVSTHDVEQVRRAVRDGANYLGIGPAFPTQTKMFEALAGLDFIKVALAETSLPAFAIGGINLDTIDAVVGAGTKRVAVSAAIAAADDPRQIAHVLRSALS
jgi:thiamine-phosphate pyrophosphorylase